LAQETSKIVEPTIFTEIKKCVLYRHDMETVRLAQMWRPEHGVTCK